MTWKKIAEKGEIKSGSGKEFDIDGKKVAIFNQDKLYALDGLCVHQDGSLAPDGKIEDGVIECPLHFWHYDLKSGKLLDFLKDVKLNTYSVEERKDGIYIDF